MNSPLVLLEERVEKTPEGMRDGFWEVSYILRQRGNEMMRLVNEGVGERERVGIEGMFDAVEESVRGLEGGVEGVRCMDFWVARFGTA